MCYFCQVEHKTLTFLAVTLSLTLDAANILKAVILSTTRGTDSKTDEHCRDIMFHLICDNHVINCLAAITGCRPVLISSAMRL